MSGECCSTHLLSDESTGEDELGPHSRLAAVLADAIAASPSGSACLVGEWGSGKSSVINMLRKRLEETRGDVVFVFDAWAHSADSLRRAFLLALADELVLINLLSPKLRKQIENRITGSLRLTESVQRTRIRPRGLALVGSLVLMPALASAIDALPKTVNSCQRRPKSGHFPPVENWTVDPRVLTI